MGYRFDAIKGQRIEVDVDAQGLDTGQFFIDLFRMRGLSSEEWVRVASADRKENRLEFEPRRVQSTSFPKDVKDSPNKDAATVESINGGAEFWVLAEFEKFWLVKTQQGNLGWLQMPTEVSTEM